MHLPTLLLATAATHVLARAASSTSPAPGRRQAQAAPVFTPKTYDEISISGGTAGNAEQEALAVFSALDADALADASDEDVDFLSAVNSICNDAEEGAFNPAIEEAGEDSEAGQALQRGKIKNKVLKLEATMMRLRIEQARGANVTGEMEEEEAKLQSNIAQDEEEAGAESTALEFDASTDE